MTNWRDCPLVIERLPDRSIRLLYKGAEQTARFTDLEKARDYAFRQLHVDGAVWLWARAIMRDGR